MEDEDSCERLTTLGCDAVPGYWLSRPVAGADIVRVVARRDGLAAVGPVERVAAGRTVRSTRC